MDPLTLTFFIRLVVALGCGIVLGMERFLAHKSAGVRTYALVAMGAALFVIVGEYVSLLYGGKANSDPLRMASQVITGIGFLGAGLIILRGDRVTGVTTASGIWVAAGVGVAAGFGLFSLAFLATLLALFIFVGLWYVETKYVPKLPVYPDTNHGEKE